MYNPIATNIIGSAKDLFIQWNTFPNIIEKNAPNVTNDNIQIGINKAFCFPPYQYNWNKPIATAKV